MFYGAPNIGIGAVPNVFTHGAGHPVGYGGYGWYGAEPLAPIAPPAPAPMDRLVASLVTAALGAVVVGVAGKVLGSSGTLTQRVTRGALGGAALGAVFPLAVAKALPAPTRFVQGTVARLT